MGVHRLAACLKLAIYTHCSDMSHFHNHFKYEFRKIWNDAEEVDLEDDGSLENFLDEAESIYTHLDMHHSIEVGSHASQT